MDHQIAPELKLLGAAIIIGLVQLGWAATAGHGERADMAWSLGPRDEPRPLMGVAGRLERAFRNFMETFPMFAVAVIAADLAGKLGALTLWGSGLYVAARALYVPLYAAGVPVARSLVWFAGTAGLVMVLVALFR